MSSGGAVTTQELWKTLHGELTNLGKSLTCPLCLSTYQDPVVLPCVHAYCRGCVTRSFRECQKCPTCCQPATKRGLVPCDALAKMVVAYKQVLRGLGWTPIVRNNAINLTQLQSPPQNKMDLVECHLHLQVTKTWERVVNQLEDKWTKNQLQTLRQERAAVVAVNEGAIVKAAVQRNKQRKSQEGREDAFPVPEARPPAVPKEQQPAPKKDEQTTHPNIPNKQKNNMSEEDSMSTRPEATKQQPSIPKEQPTKEDDPNTEQSTATPTPTSGKPETENEDKLHKDNKEEKKQEASPGAQKDVDFGVPKDMPEEAPAQTTAARPTTDTTKEEEKKEEAFSVGMIVQVQPRIWPGINKPGGTARIARIHSVGGAISFDVSYVLGGRERQVDAAFISHKPVEWNKEEGQRKPSRRPKNQQENDQPAPSRATKRGPFQNVASEDASDTSSNNSDSNNNNNNNKRRKTNTAAAKQPDRSRKRKARSGATGDRPSPAKTSRRKATHASVVVEKVNLPVLDDKEKRELAIAYYQSKIQGALDKSIVHVTTSTLSEDDKANLTLLVSESKSQNAKVKLSDVFNPKKTTMVVMPLEDKTSGKLAVSRTRTLKAMRAALAGVPIVGPSWISKCLEQKEIVVPSPEMFVFSMPTKTQGLSRKSAISLGVAKQAAHLQQQAQGIIPEEVHHLMPLVGYHVLMCGDFERPNKADIQVLVKESGASLVRSAARAVELLGSDNASVVLLCDSSPSDDDSGITVSLEEAIRERDDGPTTQVVGSGWLFDSITCADTLPSDLYKPQSPRAASLWSLTRNHS